jgi:hypothetical protein
VKATTETATTVTAAPARGRTSGGRGRPAAIANAIAGRSAIGARDVERRRRDEERRHRAADRPPDGREHRAR